MECKYYKITNNGEGSICVAGRTRVEIPGKCVDLVVRFPAASASSTVARLKQSYPLLKIVAIQDPSAATPDSKAQADTKTVAEPQADTKTVAEPQADTQGDSKAQADTKKK